MNSNDRALGAFYGLALGDALGMPTQSFSRAQIIARFGQITGLADAPADQPIAPNMPKGSITDDTEQALLMGRLLVEGGGDAGLRGPRADRGRRHEGDADEKRRCRRGRPARRRRSPGQGRRSLGRHRPPRAELSTHNPTNTDTGTDGIGPRLPV